MPNRNLNPDEFDPEGFGPRGRGFTPEQLSGFAVQDHTRIGQQDMSRRGVGQRPQSWTHEELEERYPQHPDMPLKPLMAPQEEALPTGYLHPQGYDDPFDESGWAETHMPREFEDDITGAPMGVSPKTGNVPAQFYTPRSEADRKTNKRVVSWEPPGDGVGHEPRRPYGR